MTTIDLLKHINPSSLDYQDWLSIGMALHHEGAPVNVWDEWSQQDSARYHAGECQAKWGSFHGSTKPITAATIVEIAKGQGWQPPREIESKSLDWDSVISRDDEYQIVDKHWIEEVEAKAIDDDPVKQITAYLTTLFEPGECVGYVTDTWEKDGKHLPTQGAYTRTREQLIAEIDRYDGDLNAVFGDYDLDTGVWIRFNPLDGEGVRDANVTDFRYALVESDSMPIEQQRGIYEQLELPIAALVHSGNKSLHAIVRINAPDIAEYRKRVDFLYEICKRNGLEVDRQNRNPSRLSRFPGFQRGDKVQNLVAVNVGKASWVAWKDWIEDLNDDLPDPEPLTNSWENLPPLADPLIEGVLRQGHKMLISGPSKAGKSFLLIELCAAIAEGRKWLGRQCRSGRVLYVNLELDSASCLHRFKDVYTSLEWDPTNIANIDIWNLRGKAIPLDQLAPKLIRRAAKKGYAAIVIDPIYKIITGDENAADKMAYFCNQFDRVCHELGASVIYCHHHSKGLQGGKKAADRASGSGVFARDPDAILDLIELDFRGSPEAKEKDTLRKGEESKAVCQTIADNLDQKVPGWRDAIGSDECNLVCYDDLQVEHKMMQFGKEYLGRMAWGQVLPHIVDTRNKFQGEGKTAWRVDCTLREFEKPKPIDCWFDYPVHHVDREGTLEKIEPESVLAPWQKGANRNRAGKANRKIERLSKIENAFAGLSGFDGEVRVSDIAEYLERTPKTIQSWLKETGEFEIKAGIVNRKTTEEEDLN